MEKSSRFEYCPFTQWGMAPLLVLLLPLIVAPGVRADRMDDELLRHGATMIKKLRQLGYKTVGTLPFAVKLGKKPSSWSRGPINQNMADLLESTLVYCNDPLKPLNVLNNPTQVAKKMIRGATLETHAGKQAFFNHAYPVYGTTFRTEKPDVLLTGRIDISPDMKTTSVTIVRMDRKNVGNLQFLHRFQFKTDRYLLADAGIGTSLSKKYKGVRRFSRNALDSIPLTDDAQGGNEKPGEGGTGEGSKPGEGEGKNPQGQEGSFPVDVTVFYDDAIIEREPDEAAQTTEGARQSLSYKIKTPTGSQKVRLKIKNTTPDKIGVVVMVGGLSTLYEERNWKDSPKWIMDPGAEYSLVGFYQRGDKEVKPFKVQEDSDALFQERGDAAGQIIVYVWRPATEEGALSYDGQRSLRRPKDLAGRRSVSQAQLYQSLKRGQPPVRRTAIIPSEDKAAAQLKDDKLGPVALTDVMVITYYKKK